MEFIGYEVPAINSWGQSFLTLSSFKKFSFPQEATKREMPVCKCYMEDARQVNTVFT